MNKQLKPQLDDQLFALTTVETKEELIEALDKSARLLGFDYFAYGLRVTFPYSAPRFELVNNYPLEWQASYTSNDYLSVDPTVRHGMQSIAPLIWEESIFEDARDFWEDANSYGLSHGWAQSSFTSFGVSGMLTLARSGEALSPKELREKTPLLVWFNQLAQMGLQKYLLPDLAPATNIELTQRETEIMRWTADGKTAYEISVILGIAERTVNFHLNNVLSKFQVNNKIAATARAVSLGLI